MFMFMGNFLVPLVRIPLILFLLGTYVNNVTKYYTIVLGFLIIAVALFSDSVGLWEFVDFVAGVGTAYYAMSFEIKSLDKRYIDNV